MNQDRKRSRNGPWAWRRGVGTASSTQETLPVGTEIWLDDNAPTSGHRTNGRRRIIADIASGDWHQADPDAIDATITDR